MKKVVIEGVLNNILFVLVGWFLIAPNKFSISVLLISYFIGLFVVTKIARSESKNLREAIAQLFNGIQAHKDLDEREQIITNRATKAAYQAAIICLPFSVAILFIIHGNFIVQGSIYLQPDIYSAAIILITMTMVIVQTSFILSWCKGYRQ
ncbi:hypothetical protein Hs30E_08120 [Lactococcus hodotermopsidis]|uniref:Uncharacterized protein n=1 Tax=Pseudolactococcus hodotermopsidis TaxID=2709157 RepID=A0A6A0BCZ8_9LACT|nr:hypothetical protein [Lactococcus hodotermopsidis]GFH42261.1 hypothetical protein Hs30E_08120 [Lactococcus hodotermopsidis]